MAKDPAFLFYPGDWNLGTMHLTLLDKGCYIELLILQFAKGKFTEAQAKHMLNGSFDLAWANIKDKFNTDGTFYWNTRLQIEKEKRQKFTESRRSNASKEKQPLAHEKHMLQHMEDENENTITLPITNTTKVIIGEIETSKCVLQGFSDIEIKYYNKCDEWQLKELKKFITNNQKGFESVVIRSNVLNKEENFKIVLQEFIDLIQSTGEYQESNALQRHFGNWVSKKNGSLGKFIEDCKSKYTSNGSKKNKNNFI